MRLPAPVETDPAPAAAAPWVPRPPLTATEADVVFRVGKGTHMELHKAGVLRGTERPGRGTSKRTVLFSVAALEAHHGITV